MFKAKYCIEMKQIIVKEYLSGEESYEALAQNKTTIQSGEAPRESKSQTELQRIRDAVDDTAKRSGSLSQFRDLLRRDFHITVKESCGRWSHLPK